MPLSEEDLLLAGFLPTPEQSGYVFSLVWLKINTSQKKILLIIFVFCCLCLACHLVSLRKREGVGWQHSSSLVDLRWLAADNRSLRAVSVQNRCKTRGRPQKYARTQSRHICNVCCEVPPRLRWRFSAPFKTHTHAREIRKLFLNEGQVEDSRPGCASFQATVGLPGQ